MEKYPKWTSRGTSHCLNCGHSCSNAWKPKHCQNCTCEIGGSYVPKPKKQKLHVLSEKCVVVVDSEDLKIFSVELTYRHNRVFVVQEGSNFVCHSDRCKEKRAVHIASDVSFACDHTKLVKSFCYPTSAKTLTEEDIINYKCDSRTRTMLLEAIHPPQEFRHIVQISSNCYAVFHGASQGPSNPTGYCHVIKDSDGQWYCSQKSCGKKSGNSKQLKVRYICAHLHVLFCILRLSSTPPDTASTSNVSPMVSSTPDIEQESLGVSRSSTIALNMKRKVPYPVPQEILTACRDISDISCFVPPQRTCDLSASPLSGSRGHPGQGPDDVSYLLTPWIFSAVEIQVKVCTNRDCKAMHQVWPINQGLFNICDKVIVAIEILEHWRELFKRGVPLNIAIESSLCLWTRCRQVQLSASNLKYITGLLCNGFYAFELLSNRCLDSVVCGICGVVGQVHFGDGNGKNCCSIDLIEYPKGNNAVGGGEPISLENFMEEMKAIFVEGLTYSNSKLNNAVQAERVPPIIAPSLRSGRTFNTEMEKKSVYLKGKFFEKDKIIGDPMFLHHLIKSKPLDMASLDSLNEKQLRAICRECKIDNPASLSKALLIQRLQVLYSSLLTGSSPCHGFTQVPGNTGGFYHMVCRHGTTMASKFLLLRESVRDAVDLYLSLKCPPVVLVNDTPCGFVRHLDLREPTIGNQLWGDCMGCFEKPSLETEPKQVSVPQVVPSEFSSVKLSAGNLNFDPANPLQHPLTGSTRRYVVGDRFHTSTNPHKSKLCGFHDINLCIQRDTIKTSYQECQNNSKNIKRLRSSTMQSFPVHFIYNYLMDFYHNESIVQKQHKQLSSTLQDGQILKREKFLRFVVVNIK